MMMQISCIGVKNVQTLLAPKKPGAIDKDSAKEKPPKQNKRSHSDVANESVMDLLVLSCTLSSKDSMILSLALIRSLIFSFSIIKESN
jgi:hypothetical protein